MAARVKCLVPLLLHAGILALLTVSASAEDVNVTFVVKESVNYNGVFLIGGNSSSLTPSRPMTPTPGDVWVLTVTLTKGVAYQYYLKALPLWSIYECICPSSESTVLTVAEDYVPSLYAELVTGYDCSKAACPLYTEGKSGDGIRQVV